MQSKANPITKGRGLESLVQFMNDHPSWIILDNSQNSDYGTCPEKFNYVYNTGVAGISSTAAEFGKWMVHEPFEWWYTHGMDRSNQISEQQWNEWWNAFANTIRGPAKPSDGVAYTLANAKTALHSYITTYHSDQGMYKVLRSEKVFWSTLPNLEGVVWLSKPDLVFETIASGQFMTVDIKSSIWDTNERLVPFDRQFVGQAYATGSTEMMKIFVHFELGGSGSNRRCNVITSRQRIKLDSNVLESWIKDTEHDAKAVLESYRTDVWPKRAPIACHQFNRLCEMYTLCENNGDEMVLKGMHRANPLAYLGLSRGRGGRYSIIDQPPPVAVPVAMPEIAQIIPGDFTSTNDNTMFDREMHRQLSPSPEAWPSRTPGSATAGTIRHRTVR